MKSSMPWIYAGNTTLIKISFGCSIEGYYWRIFMITPITKEIYQVGGDGLTASEDAAIYLLYIDGQAAIVDAGCGNATRRLLENIRHCGVPEKAIEYLLITHCHYDHTGGAAELKKRLKLNVVAHHLEAPYLEKGDPEVTAASWYGATLTPVSVDIKLKQHTQSIRLGQRNITAIHLPGHSPGSLVFQVESEGQSVLFAQDVHGPIHPDLLSDPRAYQTSLKEMLNLKDDICRAERLKEKGIEYVDAGVSGGIWGLKIGYCLMMGGKRAVVEKLEPVFKTLAPENGFLYCGKTGSGHFVKMVHNGIEYGLMQAYGEGFEILEASPYSEAFDYQKIAHLWNQGSVVRSWLLELLEDAFDRDPRLQDIKGYVEDSGEGRWTLQQAIDTEVPAPVTALSLFARFRSRQENTFTERVLAALRREFGGHAVKTGKD